MKKIITTKISSWGNSYGLRLPKDFVADTGVSLNHPLSVVLTGNKTFEVREMKTGTEIKSKEYYVTMFKKQKKFIKEELDWGKPQGKEIW